MKDQNECSICLLELSEKDCKKLNNCMHSFHFLCVEQWASQNNSCPLCRKPITNKIKISNETDLQQEIIVYQADIMLEIEPDLNYKYPEDESLDSDEEDSIDYGDESDFEEEVTFIESSYNRYFRLTDSYGVLYE